MRGTYHVQSRIFATPARSLARTVARRTCVQDTIYFIGAFFYVFAALPTLFSLWAFAETLQQPMPAAAAAAAAKTRSS